MPRQQFVDAIDRVIGDASQYLTQVRIGFDAIQQCRADQTVEGGRTRAAVIGASEQVVTATQDKGADGTLRRIMPTPGLCRFTG